MDKKKVKKLIEKILSVSQTASDEDYIHGKVKSHIINTLQVALEELSKSDWVSVEDGLPEYCEKVFAYDKEMQDYPFVTMRYKAGKEKLIDKNGFRIGLHVTHWKPIEKLEE